MTCSHATTEAIDRDDTFGFMCDGCLEMGYGNCYNCKNGCDYQLHVECRTASAEATHLFEQRSFFLQHQNTPNTTKLCEACGMTVKGWRYHTDQGSTVFLHPWCFKQPHSIKLDDVGEVTLRKKLESIACYYCKYPSIAERLDGWAYVTADKKLGFHVKCMKEKMYETWSMYSKVDNKETEAQHEELVSSNSGTQQFQQSDQQQHRGFVQQPGYNVGQQQYRDVYQQPGYNDGQHHHHYHHIVQHNYYHPPPHHQYYPYAGQQQNYNPAMTPGSPDKPASNKKKGGFGRMAASTAGLIFTLAAGDPVGVVSAMGEFL